MAAPSTTQQEWDKIRKSFATSIMVDTSLFSLAQNLEGQAWPINDKEDTPAKYIDLAFMEAIELLAMKGQPPEVIDQLVSILRETMAFDQPFGDMVTQVEVTASKDNAMLKTLGRLGVPESFPIDFTALDADTREFCRLEKLGTLGEFAVFAQNMSQNVIVGGDFRTLLNALAHADEASLARYIPVRPGSKGLFLPDAIKLCLLRFPKSVLFAMADRAGLKLTAEQQQEVRLLARQDFDTADSELRLRVSRLVAELFKEQLSELQQQLNQGSIQLDRYLTPIGDPLLEKIIAAQLKPYLQKPAAAPAQESHSEPRKRGFWARLFGRS